MLRKPDKSCWHISLLAFQIAISILFIGGCSPVASQEGIDGDLTIRDLAYDVNKSLGYTVYLLENEQYVPYLVLTDNYGGNCLLLRKHLLDDIKPFSKQSDVPSYYESSEIDSFLNSAFISSLSSNLSTLIVVSDVVITDILSIGSVGTDTFRIQRKVFLLSYTETAQEESLSNAVEGSPLKYFADDIDAVIAQTSVGQTASWWLRTPNTAYFNTVYGISPEGYVGVCSVGGTEGTYENGVRPAFCLPEDTVIYQGKINAEEVYMIK